MRVVAAKAGRTLWAAAPAGLSISLDELPAKSFPCLIYDHDGDASEDWRHALAARLVECGCRYAVCAGMNCDAWEDAFDLVCAMRGAEDEHVMTTAHPDDTLAEIAFFFVRLTNFGDHDFQDLVVLHIGTGPAAAAIEQALIAEF